MTETSANLDPDKKRPADLGDLTSLDDQGGKGAPISPPVDLNATTADVSQATAVRKLNRLGDYRLLRELGRGGMGIVYEAEQESLGRHVALKVLPPHTLLDPQRLRRFHREARAAARLHHTNIVPVFGVGEEDGLHYYVMQFIQGLGLDQVLKELRRLQKRKEAAVHALTEGEEAGKEAEDPVCFTVAQSLLSGRFSPKENSPITEITLAGEESRLSSPLRTNNLGISPSESGVHLPGLPSESSLSSTGRGYWQSVARIGIQVAEALAYANGQGIVHRDIKPSNLLLDTQGMVWVADFGLAKATEGDDLTNPVEIVGTVRYMAPERFKGQSDARADVYSLGLTLYELLTFQPAYEENDRETLMKRIVGEEPPRPRKLNPDVPLDLETIVLKALAKEPEHRYQTAAAVAEDLRRFLEDRPIKARRASTSERLLRWCRRNSAIAALLFSVAALLIVLAIGSLFTAYWMTESRNEVLKERDRAVQAEKERRVSLVESLLTASPDSVPFIVETLQSSREVAVPLLRAKLDDAKTAPRQRLRAALAMTMLGEERASFLLDSIPSAPSTEFRNVLTALATVKEQVKESLLEWSRNARRPETRVRFALALLELGDSSGAQQVLAQAEDPVNRVTFIHEFPAWHGDLSGLPALLKETSDSAFRSGMCAALGSIEPESLSAEERKPLESELKELFVTAPDGSTHSAAGWALRRWKVQVPSIAGTPGPVDGKGWFVNRSGLTMLEVKPGIFTMGDATMPWAEPHQVVLTRSIFMCDRETPISLFRQFLADPNWPAGDKPNDWKDLHEDKKLPGDYPLNGVSWVDALQFCNWLSRTEGRQPCYVRTGPKPESWYCNFEADGYRLPTEAEWEYACRAGTTTLFPFGTEATRMLDYGNVELLHPLEGGSRLPNGWGFFDMIGNVWELVWDGTGSAGRSLTIDPSGPLLETLDKQTRGASYGAGSFYARSAFHFSTPYHDRGAGEGSRGIRLVCHGRKPDAGGLDLLAKVEAETTHAAVGPALGGRAAETLKTCGHWYAEHGYWDKAGAAFAKSMALDASNPETWYLLAMAYLDGGNKEEFDETCQHMIQRFGQSTEGKDVSLTLSACISAPNLLADRMSVLGLVNKASSLLGFPHRVLGAALCCVGQSKEAFAEYGKVQNENLLTVFDWLYLAMINQRLGNSDEAKKLLEKSQEWLDRPLGDKASAITIEKTLLWHVRHQANRLRKEAEALIDGPKNAK